MFCSKCGKQISDDAVFCEGCGNPTASVTNTATQAAPQVVYVQQAPQIIPQAPVMSEGEKSEKTRAVALFVMSSLFDLCFWWFVSATKFGMLSFLFEGAAPSYLIDDFLEKLYEECGGILIFVCVIMTIGTVVQAVVSYILPYMKRNFAAVQKSLIINNVIDIIISLYAAVSIFAICKSELDTEPYLLFFISAVLAFGHVCVIITYNKAVGAEKWEKRKEQYGEAALIGNPSGYRANSTLSKLARLNGSEEQSAPKFWLCNSCGTKNSNTESFCNGCGKYK